MKSRILLALSVLAVLTGLPSVFAAPITASLNWSSQSIVSASHDIATFTVVLDPDCPVGKTFTGTLTVIEPDGTSNATVTIGSTPCGTVLTADYPSSFTGTASTLGLGTYTAIWMGTTSVTIGGLHPSFRLQDNFVVNQFPPKDVPEFQAPMMLVAVVGLAVVVAVKKKFK